MHLAIDSQFPEIRRSVNTYLVQATDRAPQLANSLIRDALMSFLSRGHPSSKTASTPTDDQVQSWNKHSRLSTLLLSVVSFGDDVDLSVRETTVVEHIVLAHHGLLCSPFFKICSATFIRLTLLQVVQIVIPGLTCVRKPLSIRMRSSISILINCSTLSWMLHVRNQRYVGNIMCEVPGANFVQYGFPEASYSAVTTLCFVSPASVLPRVVKQLQADLNPASLNALSDFDLGVWATPEGTTFVDGWFLQQVLLLH